MLEQISYLGKLWFLRYGPKCSGPIRLQDFSINRRTIKLAVSHKEINEINWFLVCHSNSFCINGSLGFLIFGTMIGNSNIEKLTAPVFPGKFIFGPNLGKRARNGPKIGYLGFLKNFVMLVFLGNNLYWKLILLLLFDQHIWHNFGSPVLGQKAASQWNCRIL